jgi:glycosyltransferase involved in cell wall biosynthesis
VGSLDRAPSFVDSLRRQAATDGIADRARFSGPRTGAELAAAYARADALVLASHAETYGMVVTEALAHGLPVVATAVGGLPDALGHGKNRARPGLLVRRADPVGLGNALCAWLTDAPLRARLRQAAAQRRDQLTGWSTTAAQVSAALAALG